MSNVDNAGKDGAQGLQWGVDADPAQWVGGLVEFFGDWGILRPVGEPPHKLLIFNGRYLTVEQIEDATVSTPLLPPNRDLSPAEQWELLHRLSDMHDHEDCAVLRAIGLHIGCGIGVQCAWNNTTPDAEPVHIVAGWWPSDVPIRDPAVLRTAANRLETLQAWLQQGARNG